MASAQVKSAVLLAGLAADGETVVARAGGHPGPHRGDAGRRRRRRHHRVGRGRAGWSGSVGAASAAVPTPCPAIPPRPPSGWSGSVIIPGSLVTVAGIDLGIERLGFVGVLRRMGATIEVEEAGNGTGSLTAYYAASCTAPTSRPRRSPRSTRCPSWPWPRPAAVGTTRFSRRRRAPGEGVRPPGRDRRAGAGLRRRGRGRGRRPGGRGRRRPAAAGTGGCPGRPPDGHGRRRGRRRLPGRGRPHHHRRMGVGGHQLSGLLRRPGHGSGRARRAR